MSMSITGLEGLMGRLNAAVEAVEEDVTVKRQQVASALVDAMISNIPVWSGATMSSITVGAGEVNFHSTGTDAAAYGHTSRMALGEEPMFGTAAAAARATVAAANYDMAARLAVTAGSDAWPFVELAQAPNGPGQKARNAAVVSQIAIQKVRAAFPFLR